MISDLKELYIVNKSEEYDIKVDIFSSGLFLQEARDDFNFQHILTTILLIKAICKYSISLRANTESL